MRRLERVLLMGMPIMLRQILRKALTDAGDFEMVEDSPSADLGSQQVLDLEPDVIILDALQTSVSAVDAVLYRRCSSRILGISADGRQCTLYEMRPHRVALGELTPDSLLAVLRRGRGGES